MGNRSNQLYPPPSNKNQALSSRRSRSAHSGRRRGELESSQSRRSTGERRRSSLDMSSSRPSESGTHHYETPKKRSPTQRALNWVLRWSPKGSIKQSPNEDDGPGPDVYNSPSYQRSRRKGQPSSKTGSQRANGQIPSRGSQANVDGTPTPSRRRPSTAEQEITENQSRGSEHANDRHLETLPRPTGGQEEIYQGQAYNIASENGWAPVGTDLPTIRYQHSLEDVMQRQSRLISTLNEELDKAKGELRAAERLYEQELQKHNREVHNLNTHLRTLQQRVTNTATTSIELPAVLPLQRPESVLRTLWHDLAYAVGNLVLSHFKDVRESKMVAWADRHEDRLQKLTPSYKSLLSNKKSAAALIEATIWDVLCAIVFGDSLADEPVCWAGNHRRRLIKLSNRLWEDIVDMNLDKEKVMFHQWKAITTNLIATTCSPEAVEEEIMDITQDLHDMLAEIRPRVVWKSHRSEVLAIVTKAVELDKLLCAQQTWYCVSWPSEKRHDIELHQNAMLHAVDSPRTQRVRFMVQPGLFRAKGSNLPYEVKPYDVEEVLARNGFGDLDKIHISVDPVSARNPGYCFVDFHDRETADRALSSLSATIRGRSIKVGPCKPKKTNERRDNRDEGSTSRRWGDWNASDDRRSRNEQPDSRREQRGPNWALDHFDDMVQTGSLEGRRLYVGGLDKMIDQDQHQRELAELFSGFTPAAISKRITPHESTRSQPGNHHYCFVDFDTKEEASAAVEALNGKPIEGGFLKVSISRKMPRKLCGMELCGSEKMLFRMSRRGNA
ncbi:hypothetical protein FDECE_10372 [Fusarium decemcellulare]|nr:hypothetical protein FDECE_10372 [Fusarium decemcellulare]